MKRILIYDCNTVDTGYAPLVCREIMMQDDLIDRLACGYVSKASKEELQKQGFRVMGAEERGNRAGCTFITELVSDTVVRDHIRCLSHYNRRKSFGYLYRTGGLDI